jgi:hypothetical protein
MKYKRGIKHGKKGYIHRLVMEEKLGRALLPDEIVHHIDRNTHNNSPENLTVMTSDDHINFHKGG